MLCKMATQGAPLGYVQYVRGTQFTNSTKDVSAQKATYILEHSYTLAEAAAVASAETTHHLRDESCLIVLVAKSLVAGGYDGGRNL